MSPITTTVSARLTRTIGAAIAVPVLALATLSLSLVGPAAPAAAASEHLVTFVARVCPSYTDIPANKLRNEIQESLRDLGPDTTYRRDQEIDPRVELDTSAACSPLPDWTFALGTHYASKSAGSLELSTVTGRYPDTATTGASTAWLDSHGNPTGDTIDGAVTVALTADQARKATAGGRNLWVQGGTPSAPLNGRQDKLGYGALRCAVDALNGDNVEYLRYPRGTTHTFCFYYAVTPPPTAGEIVVHKEVSAGATGTSHAMFTGTVPYGDTDGNGINDFTLDASDGNAATASFVRGAVGVTNPAWTITETDDPDWMLVDGHPTCTSRDGTSALTYTDNGVSIDLAGLDRVECTFTNAPVPDVQQVVEPPRAQPTPVVTPTPTVPQTPRLIHTPQATPQLAQPTPVRVPTATPQATPQATPHTIATPHATPLLTPHQVPTATPQATPHAVPSLVAVPQHVSHGGTPQHVSHGGTPQHVSHGGTPQRASHRTPQTVHQVATSTARVSAPTGRHETPQAVAGRNRLSHTGTDESTLWLAGSASALLLTGGALVASRRRSRS